jgi:hypothetical protein
MTTATYAACHARRRAASAEPRAVFHQGGRGRCRQGECGIGLMHDRMGRGLQFCAEVTRLEQRNEGIQCQFF